MMKVKLLGHGGFYGMRLVEFPALVDATFYPEDRQHVSHWRVSSEEIIRIGGSVDYFSGFAQWHFLPSEVEVIHE